MIQRQTDSDLSCVYFQHEKHFSGKQAMQQLADSGDAVKILQVHPSPRSSVAQAKLSAVVRLQVPVMFPALCPAL
jgi:hypothetical protein